MKLLHYTILLTIVLVSLNGCSQSKRNIPFPNFEVDSIHPQKIKIGWTSPIKGIWQDLPSDSIKLPWRTVISFENLPSTLFDTLGFQELPIPDTMRLNWSTIPTIPYDLDTIKEEKVSWTISSLEKPKKTIARLPARNYDVKLPVFTITDDNDFYRQNIECYMCDDLGRIWFGTSDGLYVYDGVYFTFYKLGYMAYDILQVDKNEIWTVSDSGIDVINIQLNCKAHMTSDLPYYKGSITKDASGRIWITHGGLTNDNIQVYDPIRQSIKKLQLGIFSPGLTQDLDGNMWIRSGGEILVYSAKEKSMRKISLSLTYGDPFIRSSRDDIIQTIDNSLTLDQNGTIWFGYHGRLYSYTTNSSLLKSVCIFPSLNLPFQLNVQSLVPDSRNGTIVMKMLPGLGIYNPAQNEIKVLSGKGINISSRIIIGRNGQIWSAPYLAPLNVFNPNDMKIIAPDFAKPKPRGIGDLAVRGKNLWIGADSGIYTANFKDNTVSRFDLAHGLYVHTITDYHDGKMLIGAYYLPPGPGPYFRWLILDPDSGLLQSTQLDGNVCLDTMGRIWSSYHSRGFQIWNSDLTSCKTLTLNDRSVFGTFPIICDHTGKLWFMVRQRVNGMYSRDLLYRYDPAADAYSQLELPDDLQNRGFTNIFEDSQGLIWVGSYNGLYSYNPADSSLIHLTEEDGLGGRSTSGIKEINQQIYLTTENGVSVIDVNNGYFKVSSYNNKLGYEGTSINGPAVMGNRDHSVVINDRFYWYSGSGNIFSVSSSDDSTTTPQPYIVDLDISGVNFKLTAGMGQEQNLYANWCGRFGSIDSRYEPLPDTLTVLDNGIMWDSLTGPYFIPANLTVSHEENDLRFYYTGMNLNTPGRMRYSFTLDGFDERWSAVTDQPYVDYRNIPPGHYTFKVVSHGFNGKWSTPAEFSFTITPPWWQTGWAYSGFAIAALVGVVSLVLGYNRFRSRKLLQQKKILENTVVERTAEILHQKQLVEEKNRTVSDSIRAAKYLQDAILPSKSLIQSVLSSSFVIYLPKDVVAGDFYWIENRDNLIFAAVADCTGHGVPGAMGSIICSAALTRAINEFEITEPGRVLDKARELILQTYTKSGEIVDNGMDIAFVSIDISTKILQYAGANNDLWILRNSELIELKADSQPVGKFVNSASFETTRFQLQNGDTIYLVSDGFADQFGGEKGKKFKTQNFKNLLIAVSTEPLEEQKKIICQTFDDWKGHLEQVDDVCVMAIKV